VTTRAVLTVLSVFIFGVCVVALAPRTRHSVLHRQDVPVHSQIPVEGISEVSAAPRLVKPARAEDGVTLSYRDRLKNSKSYLQFVTDVLPAARSEDRDAQYFLYKALFYCQHEGAVYLRQNGRLLAPDEVVQYALERHLSYEYANTVFVRCSDLLKSDSMGPLDAEQWLASATAAKQPAAESVTALRELSTYSNVAGNTPTSEETHFATPDPWRLLSDAVRSGDPDVFANIAKAQGDQRLDAAAWSVVACNAGFDCGPASDVMQRSCQIDSNCEPNDGFVELMEKASGADWPAILARAQSINAHIHAGEWNLLNLDKQRE
jgi:hypothetical protein